MSLSLSLHLQALWAPLSIANLGFHKLIEERLAAHYAAWNETQQSMGIGSRVSFKS